MIYSPLEGQGETYLNQPNTQRTPLHETNTNTLLARDAVVAGLAEGTPSIVVESVGENAIHLNPMTSEAGEEQIILSRLLELASICVTH